MLSDFLQVNVYFTQQGAMKQADLILKGEKYRKLKNMEPRYLKGVWQVRLRLADIVMNIAVSWSVVVHLTK